MLNWVDILRRILSLYKVRTQSELGMALGLTVNVGLDSDRGGRIIPWEILEKVVEEKKVSWDWLLTGAGSQEEAVPTGEQQEETSPIVGVGEAGGEEKTDVAAEPPLDNQRSRIAHRLPRIETRELERRLLPREGDRNVVPPELDAPPSDVDQSS